MKKKIVKTGTTKAKTTRKGLVEKQVSPPSTKWTRFMDMCSGGGQKEKWDKIYIEAPEDEASIIFYNRFGHNPDRVTCTCCGNDYSVSEGENLADITAYDRGCRYAYFNKNNKEIPEKEAGVSGKGTVNGCVGKYIEEGDTTRNWNNYVTLENFIKQKDKLFITASQIKPEQRKRTLPQQGYVWMD